ncbi:MAG: GAF domain-containing protein [Chitinophagaceae bacterium]
MEDTRIYDESLIKSKVSVKPLFDVLKKSVAEGKAGSQKLYGDLLQQVEAVPELLQPHDNLALLEEHRELIEMLLATIFPPAPSSQENLYGVSFPFRFDVIYASNLFKYLFLKPGTNQVNIPDNELGKALSKEKYLFAYKMILKKYFGYHASEISQTTYPFVDPVTGLTKYLELSIDARFIDVNPAGEMPVAPDNLICKRTNRVLPLEELEKFLPLSDFIFEGLAIIKVHDVTTQEIISKMKNALLGANAFADAAMFHKMHNQVQNLLGVKDVEVGITPFFKINGHYLFSEKNNDKSLLCRKFSHAEAEKLNEYFIEAFRDVDNAIVFEDISEKDVREYPFLSFYIERGIRSMLLAPLKKEHELLGVLEIASTSAEKFNNQHIEKISNAVPYFALGLEKGSETLFNNINRVVKEQFTAVQPAVEWKFTEAALNYLMQKKHNEDAKIERIAFDNVFPVFGSIDIRNSSVERANSIQLDMIEQLQMAREIISKAHREMQFPLFQEIEFKIDKYITSVSEMLLSEEEIQIRDFLSGQVTSIFNHIKATVPTLAKVINEYYASLDPQSGMIYKHRKDYEDSITEINDVVARFIDKEQSAAQKVFPHYFERYVTDGVEFNIYIGQSIAPKKKFDEIYLRNMKIWQLTVLARSAKLTHSLESKLPHPLKTTQLILAHSIPLSISFRTAERKFDVDGAYNIRYEIVKKRIDKVRIKDTNERLTQPGKIAIVYSQHKEANEYLEYIEFLQNQKLLKPGVEKFELEELQGVSGLKALRVEVNLDELTKADQRIELSSTTSDKLLGK